MILKTKGRYAVMALVDMALQNRFSTDKPKAINLTDISARQGMTVPYLEQIFSKLRSAGLVKSVRGPGGGYILAKTPAELNIGNIIDAVNENVKMTRCESDPEQGCMVSKARCVTHDLWDGLDKQIAGFLNSITIDDVMNKRTSRGISSLGDLSMPHDCGHDHAEH